MKDILARAKVPPVVKNEGFCGPCKKSRCEICEHIVSTDTFKSTTTQRTFFIRPPDLKCSSENVVYYLHVKHDLNNIQGAQKVSGQGLIIIDMPTETF